jgi:hypothetical protein
VVRVTTIGVDESHLGRRAAWRVVIVTAVDLELKYRVLVYSTAEENYPTERTQQCRVWEQVNSRGGVSLEMFVLNGEVIVAEFLIIGGRGCVRGGGLVKRGFEGGHRGLI